MAAETRARSRSPVARENATTSGPGNRDDLECAICTEKYTNPKLLHCMHTFCNRCIEQLLSRSTMGKVVCPICRFVTEVGAGGTSELLRNHIIEQKVKWDQVSRMRDNNELKCADCETETAIKFCTNCQLKLCDLCAAHHNRAARTRDHTLQTIEGMANEELFEKELVRCPEHNEEMIHYCDTCKKTTCAGCVHSTLHQRHAFLPLAQVLERQMIGLQTNLEESERVCRGYEEHLQKIELLEAKRREEANASRTRVNDTFRLLSATLEQEKIKLLRWLDEPSYQSSQALSKAKVAVRHAKANTEHLREVSRHPKEEIHDILQEQQTVHWRNEVERMKVVTTTRAAVPTATAVKFASVDINQQPAMRKMRYEKDNKFYVNTFLRKIIPGDVATRLKSFLRQSIVLNEAVFPGPSGNCSIQVHKSRVRVGSSPQLSEPAVIGDYKWSIIIDKLRDSSDTNLGVYLQCNPRRYAGTWECSAVADFSLKNRNGRDLTDSLSVTWKSGDDDILGVGPLISWSELTDVSKGYVVNDHFTVTAHIQVLA